MADRKTAAASSSRKFATAQLQSAPGSGQTFHKIQYR
jgi:hypothetical protein